MQEVQTEEANGNVNTESQVEAKSMKEAKQGAYKEKEQSGQLS